MRPVFTIVTAAGSGTRLGSDRPKALVPLVGSPLVQRAVAGALACQRITGIIVTAPEGALRDFHALFDDDPRIRVVAGGGVRQESVYRGLQEIPVLAKDLDVVLDDLTPILIHDAARCLTPQRVFNEIITVLEAGHCAAIPALPVTDTQKIVATQPETVCDIPIERVTAAADRSRLRAVQTPQGFHWRTIIDAHRDAIHRWESEAHAATDDAALVEAHGHDVYLTRGSQMSLKITTPIDLTIAQYLLKHAAT
ncbi:MAG: 2-C-methyl-D-erythritol 4-phosphate cytidylyltransferase [Actinomycetaceae bacterium]|nr:2-C-methyl-D-erythritol 4-phosphate cytidylyltransferase [Actinomycetaceae bacterium]